MAVNDINKGLNYITYGLYIVTTCEGEKERAYCKYRFSGNGGTGPNGYFRQ